MDIDEIKEKKRVMENEILAIVKSFVAETGLEVSHLDLTVERYVADSTAHPVDVAASVSI